MATPAPPATVDEAAEYIEGICGMDVKVEDSAALDAGIGSEDERLMFEKREACEICAGEEGVRLAGLGGTCAFD